MRTSSHHTRTSVLSLIAGVFFLCAAAALIVWQFNVSDAAHSKVARALDAQTSDSSSAASNSDNAADQDEPAPSSDRSWKSAFDPKMVVAESDYEVYGRAMLDIALVNATPDADLEQTAKACGAANKSRAYAVNCIVYDSTEAWEFKNTWESIPEEYRAGITGVCYTIRASWEDGRSTSIVNMGELQGALAQYSCPNADRYA